MYNVRKGIVKMSSLASKTMSRKLSLTCRGEPIQHEQLFEYTNGRFLVNEKRELSKRYVKFDVDALCSLVSALPSVSSPIFKIDKMEGGFNKAMLMTAENGKEIIAKIPFPSIVPSEYSTASEAAVLEYVRSRTSVPVSQVVAWSSDSSNPVGSEYIILEKAKGRQLVDVWGEMDQPQQFKLIKGLAQLEAQLASLEFPAYGNIYFRHSAPGNIGATIPIDDEYCVGPAYNDSWLPQLSKGLHAGPWRNISELGLALASRGLAHVQHSALVARRPHFGTHAEHTHILEATKKIFPQLAGLSSLQRFSKPTLWHNDLHLGNIYVSEQDPTTIVNIIDWQFMSIMPAFMQAQWPSFITPPDDYEIGMVKPELPPNYDEMDSDEKAYARTERDRALLSKCYEAALAKHHLPSYLALTRVDSDLRQLFSFCENTAREGIVPLRDSLIQVSGKWNEMGSNESCPYLTTDEDLSNHKLEVSAYKDWQTLKGYTQELLQSDDDGWVSPQLDFDKVSERHDELYRLYMERETEELSEEDAKRLWYYIEES